jgi:hypothetical protein
LKNAAGFFYWDRDRDFDSADVKKQTLRRFCAPITEW